MSADSAKLRAYYKILPFEALVQWLDNGTHEESGLDLTCFREFAFEREKHGGASFFQRYRYFCGADELRQAAIHEAPLKIDVGAQYDLPRTKQATDARVVLRELVFDIDMDAYDDIRKCCQGATMCGTCWPLCKKAVQMLERFLRIMMAYRKFTCVYSGRRGVHLWVHDTDARALSKAARMSLVKLMRSQLDTSAVRIDSGVTGDPRHLCKMPLCVHPKTGHVCVPISDIRQLEAPPALTIDDAIARPAALAAYARLLEG